MLGELVGYYKTDYTEFEALVNQVYGVEFEFPMDQEASNDTEHQFNIDGRLNKYDQEKIQSFINGESVYFISRTLLNDLCAKNYIPAGRYLITVSW